MQLIYSVVVTVISTGMIYRLALQRRRLSSLPLVLQDDLRTHVGKSEDTSTNTTMGPIRNTGDMDEYVHRSTSKDDQKIKDRTRFTADNYGHWSRYY